MQGKFILDIPEYIINNIMKEITKSEMNRIVLVSVGYKCNFIRPFDYYFLYWA